MLKSTKERPPSLFAESRHGAPEARRDLICFAREWHAPVWFTPQWIVSHLTPWYRILYVTPPFYARDVLGDLLARRLPRGGLELLRENLTRYAPPKYLPVNYRFPALEPAMRRARLAHLQKVCHRLNIRDPILLIWDPKFRDMVGQFKESLVCYFVDDQYSLFSGAACTAAEEERLMVGAADVVLCTSEPLCEDKRRFNSNVHLVEEAVDYSLFASTTSDQLSVPSELKDITSPIFGFVGLLNDKVDYELLTAIASDNPDWCILLVGPNKIYSSEYQKQFANLLSMKNVKSIGFRPQHEVPAYLKRMDVCAIPNKVNEYTRYVCPLKLHEYLAAGKPVVSTDMPSVRPFEGLIRIAHSRTDWRKYLQEALREKSQDWVERRQAIARSNTWEIRGERVHDLFRQAMENTQVSLRARAREKSL